MTVYRVKKINKIAPEGLELFTDKFIVNEDENDPQGIILRSSPVDVDDYPSLLAVARAGAGTNNVNVERATKKGICVFNTPGANANAVVDLVFPMLGVWKRNIFNGINFCKSLTAVDPDKVDSVVEAQKSAYKGEEIAGKNLTVVGLGQIGVRLANGGIQRLMNVKGFDPAPALENIHQLSPQVRVCRALKDAVSDADVISLHLPLNDRTRNLVNAEFLAKVKRGAILINYSRAPIVDEQAVLDALDSGQLGAFLSDFPTAKTIGHEKILTTPHLGASTSQSEGNCSTMAVKELSSYLKYGNVVHSVNFPNIESTPADTVKNRLIVINKDVPGMIANVSNIFSGFNVNIVSYLNQSNGAIGYNIIDMEETIPEELVAKIVELPDVIRTRVIEFA
ncbi:phosphoglycerate dehydrogenase [Desulfotalea psychrophila]|uniref:D-3-phosphoglycerate dehydrogenase n=1 Tax=Desulfotalea psychrophila (strain LSv54 / DSM 12343) TaxID=177439 RepID=Q6AMI7_DESPS|nr:phosphoglycerate dehydrogenase [Desulfotalea psychrophila]CAG36438.1 related to D-3-phosphoglycerate dehydrogenase [Desulfotalea psychrophila LSv54]